MRSSADILKTILEGREKIEAVPRDDKKSRKELENVGRPGSADPRSDKSTYTRQAEIYRKIIETAIELEGGETKINLNPKLKLPDSENNVSNDTKNKRKKKDEKAPMQENIIEAVKKSLTSLAKNSVRPFSEENTKVVKKDLETQAPLKEAEQIDELSKKTLGSYVKSAADNQSFHSFMAGDLSAKKQKDSLDHDKKAFKRQAGIEKATDRLTKEEVEVENVEELFDEVLDELVFENEEFMSKVYEEVVKRGRGRPKKNPEGEEAPEKRENLAAQIRDAKSDHTGHIEVNVGGSKKKLHVSHAQKFLNKYGDLKRADDKDNYEKEFRKSIV